MRLIDVLKLPKQPHSLGIIKEFLTQPLSTHDAEAAFTYYLDIADTLELYDLVFTESETYLKDLEHQQESEYEEKVLKFAIHAAIQIQAFDKAKVYIEQRKQILPILKQYLGVLDEIMYKKALQIPYLEDLHKIINDIIPDQTKIFCLEEMFEIYKSDHQYEMALNSLYMLYEYDLKNKYVHDELALLIILKKYEDALKIALNELRKDPKDVHALLALIEVYIERGDLQKASSLEAENEEEFDKAPDEIKKKAYQLCIKLYQKLDNKLSLDLYQKKHKAFVKSLEKKTKVQEEVKPEVVVVSKLEPKTITHHKLLKSFELAQDLITYSHLIDEKLLLRDYLRLFFLHVDKHIESKEHIVYINGETPNLYHYKKERLYDKTIPSNYIEQSLFESVLSHDQEIMDNPSHLKYNKNILTQKEYEDDISFVYAFPIGDIGVYLIHFEQKIEDPGEYYDILKVISSVLFAHLIDEKKLSKIKKENRFYKDVINSPIVSFRELTEARSTYNDAAQALLKIDKHYHLELFLRDVSYEFVHLYKDTIFKMLAKPGLTKELLYKYQEKHILEKLYSLKIGDEIIVMSIFFDQTKEAQETKDLIEKATVDHETGLSNLYALSNELIDEIKDKASLFLIELSDHLKHIYGTDKVLHFFKEFAQHTKKFFSEGKTYRFDYHQLMVIVPTNDIRSVTKMVKDYFKYLDHLDSTILKYEKFNANMGILRYPVVTTEKNKDKLYRYLDIALEKAKRDKEDRFVFFVYRDYEDELFEQQVIDHLNVAIEQKNLGIVFNQITDIKKNLVWQYESELALHNLSIDNKYLMAIAKKRNRLIELEKFHMRKVVEFLVELEKETERLIKLTIPISRETFLDPTFNTYLLGIFKSYGIPYEFIRIKFDMDLRASHYAPQIQELVDHGISIDTTSLDMALNYPFHALHLDLKKESVKYNSYLTKVKELLASFNMALVVRNVKTKDQKESLDRLGVTYIEGPLYKQLPAQTLIHKIKESL
ncbi:MAG: GGDEF domain-containing protein [Acholeplasmataceae bacterium]|jgi:EAL domain-containing protein (putative c-di-GMP-specific phosphodiesterase class I)/GGDEF domain-containing protein|nr:GGDEF domain-containing protein [Acholeplasmataceae bacterium]